jgi:Zn-dependent protease/CBS domain-containing protein
VFGAGDPIHQARAAPSETCSTACSVHGYEPMFLRNGIRLGKLFGIQIFLDWSLVVIFALVVMSLGAGAFPSWHPDWSPALIWGVAVAAAVLFFVSILLHELSHALVAKAYRIPVNRITLFLFGGMANIEHDPDSPKKEALMAAIGPITSIVLGIGFSLLGAFTFGLSNRFGGETDPVAAIRSMGPLTTLLVWLGPVNILLGIFNMLPGFPLDGGRVLRAALWGATGDLRKATRWASRVGQAFGWSLIAVGLAMVVGFAFPVLGGGPINGLWLAFIGWFLKGAAGAAYQQLLIRQSLEHVPIGRLVRREPPEAVPASTSVSALVDGWLMRHDDPMFPIVDGARLLGFVRAADARRIPRIDWDAKTVAEMAVDPARIVSVQPRDSAFEALQELGRRDAEVIAVMDGDRLVGLLGRQDIVRWLSLQADDQARFGGGTLARSEP